MEHRRWRSVWEDGKKFLLVGVRDAKPVFNVTTAAGEKIIEDNLNGYPALDLPASAFRLVGAPKLVRLTPSPTGVRVADRIGGVALEAELVSARGIHAQWRAELRDGSSYLRQTVKFSSPGQNDSLVCGRTGRCSHSRGEDDWHRAGLSGGRQRDVFWRGNAWRGKFGGRQWRAHRLCLQAGTFAVAALHVWRGGRASRPPASCAARFLYYIERERARPSSPFLHYNDWYDLGFSVDAEKILDVVTNFN